MPARNTTRSESLAYLWGGQKGGRIKRILLFTYRFDFPWFHDHVLCHLRKRLARNAKVSVIATRFGDEDCPALREDLRRDMYDLGEWAPLGANFEIRYLRAGPIFHAKFALVELEGRSSVTLGGGSANLTSSGWMHNAELWSWDERASAESCASFLEDLKPKVGPGIFEPWIALLRKMRSSLSLPWLAGDDKEDARRKVFDYLFDQEVIGLPRLVRIASPFFDRSSPRLLRELLDRVSEQKRLELEIWIDGSRAVSRPSDYSVVLELCGKFKPRVKSLCVKKIVEETNDGEFPKQMHLKAIEVIGSKGSRMIFGSANFTGAAWIGSNRECIFGSENGTSLEGLLPKSQKIDLVKRGELASYARESKQQEEDKGTDIPQCVYWATYDEKTQQIEVSVERPQEITNIRINAGVDGRRSGATRDRLERIAKRFSDTKNWAKEMVRDGLIVVSAKKPLQIPERLGIVLERAGKKPLFAPVDIISPQFGEDDIRDPDTGFPWDLEAGLDALSGRHKTVADPLPKKTNFELKDEDPEIDEDEEEVESSPQLTLGGEAEYSFNPEGVRLARHLARLSRDARAKFRRALQLRKPFVADPMAKLLLGAAQLALKEDE